MDPTRMITAAPDDGRTATYRVADAGEAMWVAPAAGTDPQADKELQTLLRKRLRVACTFAAIELAP